MAAPTVREHMTPNPLTVDVTMSVAKAHRIMGDKSVRHLPVVKNGDLIGIVTLSDILDLSLSESNHMNFFEPNYLMGSVPVDELMTPEPVTISPNNSVLEAADLMFEHDIGSLPVMEDSKIIGIITKTDIFHLVVRILAEQDN